MIYLYLGNLNDLSRYSFFLSVSMLDMSIHLILLLEYVNVARGVALCHEQLVSVRSIHCFSCLRILL